MIRKKIFKRIKQTLDSWFLHLLGHDHKIYKDYIKMNKIEKDICID